MKIKAIHTEKDYDEAVEQVGKLLDAPDGSPEHDQLEVLAILIEAYEREHFPMDEADPIDALEYAFDQQETSAEQRALIFGSPSRASEVMARKRRLNLGMIRRAHAELKIPLEVLVRDYPVEKADKVEPGESLSRVRKMLDDMGIARPTPGSVEAAMDEVHEQIERESQERRRLRERR